jgi:hypothetical protein
LISQGDLVSAITVTFLGQITGRLILQQVGAWSLLVTSVEYPQQMSGRVLMSLIWSTPILLPSYARQRFQIFCLVRFFSSSDVRIHFSDAYAVVDIFPPFGFNIVVNFSELQTKYPEVMSNSPIDVRIGFANDTLDALVFRTPPTLLYPGANLIGRAHIVIRQQFKSSGPFALGVFTVGHFHSICWNQFWLTYFIEVEDISSHGNDSCLQQSEYFSLFEQHGLITRLCV